MKATLTSFRPGERSLPGDDWVDVLRKLSLVVMKFGRLDHLQRAAEINTYIR